MFEEHHQMYVQAQKLFTKGVTVATREHPSLGHPFYAQYAKGGRIVDIEDRSYIDLCMSNGAAVFGHGRSMPPTKSDFWGYESPAVIELGRLIREWFPYIESMRFCLSGTEAVLHAISLSRVITGRRQVAKFAGHYHGNCDPLQANWTDSGDEPQSDGTCRLRLETNGMYPGAEHDIHVLPFNDLEALDRFFNVHGEQLACIIVEPTAINAGCLSPLPGFLSALRRNCDSWGSLLIYDEILCGFRCPSPTDAVPDLVVLGKIVGGGWPISIIGGTSQSMLPFSRGRFHSGTHAGSSLLANRALMLLQSLRPNSFSDLALRTTHFLEEILQIFLHHKVMLRIEQSTDRFAFFFNRPHDQPIVRSAVSTDDRERLALLALLACKNGLFMRAQIHHGISFAHDIHVLKEALGRMDCVINDYAKNQLESRR